MDRDQFKIMTQASIDDIEYLSRIKSELGEVEFNDLAFQTLSKFIDNQEMISKILSIGSHNWELSIILEMENEPWFIETLLYLTRSLRSTMIENKEKGISIVERMYPEIHESLACYHDSFFLQHEVRTSNPRHRVRAYFRMLGDAIESTHKPHVLFLYKMLASNPSNQLFGRPEDVSFGKAVSSLVEISDLENAYKTKLFGVSLSQWRNIAHHSNYKYQKAFDRIVCKYGASNTQEIDITIDQLLELLFVFNKLQALQKIAVDFCLIEFMKDIQFDKYGNIELTVETIISQIGNSIGLHGFKVLSVTNDDEWCTFKIEDSADKGLYAFKQMTNQTGHFMAMLKQAGHNPIFELFSSKGQKLTEARIMSGGKNG